MQRVDRTEFGGKRFGVIRGTHRLSGQGRGRPGGHESGLFSRIAQELTGGCGAAHSAGQQWTLLPKESRK